MEIRTKPKQDVADTQNELDEASNRPNVHPISKMLIFLGPDHHLMASPIDAQEEISRKVIRLAEISKYPTVDTFVFEDANAFCQSFQKPISTSPDNMPELLYARKAVTKLHLAIIHPIKDNDYGIHDTNLEKEDFMNLYSGWRAACQALPWNHGFKDVVFDVTRTCNLGIGPMGRLIQYTSTVIALKSQRPFRSHLVDEAADDGGEEFNLQNCLVSTWVPRTSCQVCNAPDNTNV